MFNVQRSTFNLLFQQREEGSPQRIFGMLRTDGRMDCLFLVPPSISKEIGKRERVHVEKKQISLAAADKKKSTAANKDDRQLKDSKTSRLPPAAKSAWSTHGISIKFSVSQSTTRTKNHGKLKINSCHQEEATRFNSER